MQHFKLFIATFALIMLPILPVSAALTTGTGFGGIETMFLNLLTFINSVLLPFVLALGFLMFVWGLVLYFIIGSSNDESKEKGKSLMIWGIAAFLIIVIFWGIISLLSTSLGITTGTVMKPPVVTP